MSRQRRSRKRTPGAPRYFTVMRKAGSGLYTCHYCRKPLLHLDRCYEGSHYDCVTAARVEAARRKYEQERRM